ncbi:MAG: hypothetical protein P4M09_24030 [Devosia sp.]|nr:hypothetical protein [Devosia sp.]
MSRTYSRLARQMVDRLPDSMDRRSTLMRLTPRGVERGKASLDTANALNVLALQALEPAEREAFMGMLRRIVARLGADAG